ncbi:hypothetical protein A3J90_05110 [candidate division WOR-1 bacterium RIFOXYC2_FULL_37_10]|uniref:Uncharacterized protein n=1 Tax=candidate division WOR-1 bacterium RIFOXYB2_FULL_37_13 TaxID=1802579 RepID=A0A1F4SMY4_UNCSA|nr:MAG: hypothetical protein A2246_06970 [candidate division WOR-1 bacterium RIFOXYA2_FULL_37_7]OGC21759.1 MAG: hypothetical protein A2310_00435 [candidate division WOR-1 bacterium RIFOXYB2_FULL_37_13]OGC36716.1 MAG: hypothetical protein A3J90_05110 [candidate division WOR-1 bacterium RIFOXYC2_FULL_37_10]
MFFMNSFGNSETLPKPRKPLKVDNPDYSRFYLHDGVETPSSFQWLGSRVNFLMEMMKFLPRFEQVGYAGESSEEFYDALTEFGYAEGSSFWEGNDPLPTLWEGDPEDIPQWNGTDDKNPYYLLDEDGNPVHTRFNDVWDSDAGRGYTRDNFGSWHRVPRTQGDGLPWGFFEGSRAENLDFHPSVSQFNHFDVNQNDKKHYGIEKKAHDLIETYQGSSLNGPINYDNLFHFLNPLSLGIFNPETYSDIWDEGLNFYNKEDKEKKGTPIKALSDGILKNLEDYGDESYYEIIMSGFKKGAKIEAGSDGVTDGENIRWKGDSDWNNNNNWKSGDGETFTTGRDSFNSGLFDYDLQAGDHGEGAFKLMLGMLESRRRIYSAMTEIFGSNSDIGRLTYVTNSDGTVTVTATPDDAALRGSFDKWRSDPMRGLMADSHNLAFLNLFISMQHSFRSVFPAYGFNPSEFLFKPTDKSGGLPGWLFSGKDQLAFIRFNDWLYNNTQTYKNYLGSLAKDENYQGVDDDDYYGIDEYQGDVQNLMYEYFGIDNPNPNTDSYGSVYDSQPYIRTKNDDNELGKRAGWDFYSAKGSIWNPDSETSSTIKDGPNNNKIASDSGGPHPKYFPSQLMGINLSGNRSGIAYDENGNEAVNMNNWAVYDVMGLLRFGDKDVGRTIANNVRNRRDRLDYKKDMAAYHERKMELRYQEAIDKGQEQKKDAEIRAGIAQSAAKAQKRREELQKMGNKESSSKVQRKRMEERKGGQKKKNK